LTIALRRHVPRAAADSAPAPVAPVIIDATRSETLLFQLAQLDSAYAREPDRAPARTVRHDAERAALKARLAEALAEEGRAP
ncbi:MAG: hypothetical protein ACRENQ_15055, partial [Gemmatimonadaceae bacterium]